MATFETLKLDKGLYHTNNGTNAELEKQDPSENYKGTSLEGLDAFERQLKGFNIKIKGKDSSSVEKFFQTSDSAVLFPEYVSRAVKQGIEETSILDSVVATKTNINSLDYRTIASVTTEEDRELKDVAEGAFIPTTEIKTKDNLVRLHKKGRMLTASYEAIRFQRLDLFTLALKEIGAQIAHSQFLDALSVLVDGDGNNNPTSIVEANEKGKIAYIDLIKLWNALDPYNMTTIITSPTVTAQILSLPEMRDAAAGLDFHGSGKLITPLGAKIIKTSQMDDVLIALDKSFALEMVTAGDVQTDFDKLIDRQIQRAAITQISGFAKIFQKASATMVL